MLTRHGKQPGLPDRNPDRTNCRAVARGGATQLQRLADESLNVRHLDALQQTANTGATSQFVAQLVADGPLQLEDWDDYDSEDDYDAYSESDDDYQPWWLGLDNNTLFNQAVGYVAAQGYTGWHDTHATANYCRFIWDVGDGVFVGANVHYAAGVKTGGGNTYVKGVHGQQVGTSPTMVANAPAAIPGTTRTWAALPSSLY